MAQSQNVTLAEIYNSLNQLIDAYTNTMLLISDFSTNLNTVETKLTDLSQFVYGQFADTEQARNVWERSAILHREQAEKLKEQIEDLLKHGSDHIVVKLPVVVVKDKKTGDQT